MEALWARFNRMSKAEQAEFVFSTSTLLLEMTAPSGDIPGPPIFHELRYGDNRIILDHQDHARVLAAVQVALEGIRDCRHHSRELSGLLGQLPPNA